MTNFVSTGTTGFSMRAVELHGRSMWDRAVVRRTLAFMNDYALDTLVLHESDIVHEIVYPRAYFDPYALWTDMPSRRGENAIFNNRAYMRDILKLAADAGIRVMLNVKEIGFSDEILAIRPELFKNGAVCPSEPFWTEYIAHKTDELFTDFPELAGLIVSFSSQESRASRVQNRCGCSLCEAESLEAWYARMIRCLHTPATRHGKTLAVRDFAYKPADHAPLIAAMDTAPEDVVFSIKAMPHDFYLTFPDNPALGRLTRPQWVEYDVMGQFAGWGEMPFFMFEDLRDRMPRWLDAGAEGVIFRIEWERLNDLTSFDNISLANLIAGALLCQDPHVSAQAACRAWLIETGLPEADAAWLAQVLAMTPPIVLGAAYTAGFVTADNSMLPRSIERAWWGAEVRDSLIPWDSSREGALDLDAAKYRACVEEKREALVAARRLLEHMAGTSEAVSPRTYAAISAAFQHFELWVEGLALTGEACLLVRWLGQAGDALPESLQAGDRVVAALEDYAARARAVVDRTDVPHHIAMLVDPVRVDDVLRGLRAALRQFTDQQSMPA